MRAYFFTGLALAATLACSNDEATDDDSASISTTTTTTSTTTSSGGNGTGGNATGGNAAGGSCTSAGTFELTSSAVEEMGLLPVQYKCGGPNGFPGGLNISPPLQWTPGPSGTMSYAIMFRDLTGVEFLHSAIWDIPTCVFELPEDVEKTPNPAEVPGAKQCHSYNGGPFGYAGPCAPGFEAPRTYQFEIFAINAATLPAVTTDSTLAEVEAAMEANNVARDTLTVIEDGDDP